MPVIFLKVFNKNKDGKHKMETFFSRTTLLLGQDNIAKLTQAKVIVFGVGAVGSYAVEALARTGVGTIGLVDFDRVCPSNINRQLVALNSTVDAFKVDVASDRIKDINPDCTVIKHIKFADAKNLKDILSGDYDLIVDAIDVLTSKADIIEYAVKNNVKIISSMGAGVKTSPYGLKCADISKTNTCPLAKALRRILRERGILKGVSCVFSVQPPVKIVHKEKNKQESVGASKKAPIGTISYMTGIVGLTVAGEAIKILIGDQISF